MKLNGIIIINYCYKPKSFTYSLIKTVVMGKNIHI